MSRLFMHFASEIICAPIILYILRLKRYVKLLLMNMLTPKDTIGRLLESFPCVYIMINKNMIIPVITTHSPSILMPEISHISLQVNRMDSLLI